MGGADFGRKFTGIHRNFIRISPDFGISREERVKESE